MRERTAQVYYILLKRHSYWKRLVAIIEKRNSRRFLIGKAYTTPQTEFLSQKLSRNMKRDKTFCVYIGLLSIFENKRILKEIFHHL